MNRTENYNLNKPEYTDNVDIAKLNENADIIDAKLKEHSDALELAALGIKYHGAVDYYADLPLDAEIGDAYTVKYSGGSGTTPDGTEYVWGNVGGSEQWIDFSKDSYTRAEVNALLETKQDSLTAAQLAAVNSGITSESVAQIETNKNNILTVADQTTKYNICDYTRVNTAQYPDSSTGATISFDSDSLEYNINGTTNSTGTLLSNIYFDTATTKAIPNGEWVAQIFPTLENLQLQIVTNNIFSNGNRPITFTVTDDDTRSWARLYLANNKTFNNAKTKLMIIPKSVWDAGFTDYQPYAMSNVELTAAIQALQAQLSNQ